MIPSWVLYDFSIRFLFKNLKIMKDVSSCYVCPVASGRNHIVKGPYRWCFQVPGAPETWMGAHCAQGPLLSVESFGSFSVGMG